MYVFKDTITGKYMAGSNYYDKRLVDDINKARTFLQPNRVDPNIPAYNRPRDNGRPTEVNMIPVPIEVREQRDLTDEGE